MRIGIDARMLGPGFGLARYVEQLVAQIQKTETTHQFVLFLTRENWATIPDSSRFEKVLADFSWYGFAEQLRFPRIIKQHNIDLMHFPHWNVPVLYRGDFIVTIHDLIMFHYPRPEATTRGPLVYWIKDRIHRFLVGYACKASKHVIVTSEFTKYDVHETLGVSLGHMTVTYQAPFVSRNQQPDSSVLEKYGIAKPYVLYVGSAYPHKNIGGLVSAWNVFQQKYGQDYQLVLVGKASQFYAKIRDSDIVRSTPNIIFTGFVPDNELEMLYKEALVYAFPSLYEGFGLPPLEAMVHGTPVVSSNRSCLPEVLGDAVLYADPENAEQFADAIYAALSDQDTRLELLQKSTQQIALYSWKKLAQETLEIYESAVV